MVQQSAAPGHVLAERYRLETLLGEGGFGTVWRAEHLVLEAPVAIKLIDPDIAHDEVAVERFMREAKSAASLRSPHVVQILDYGIHEEQPFIAMELLEGETLQQRIKRLGRLEAADAVRILTHIARAITRAHEAGVVHRDLKPENVFLVPNDDEEIAKVLDFGVAKVDPTKLGSQSASTRTGSLLGTPYYMSPEQVLGNKEVDWRSDLWSMGVIAFEALTGKRPFFSDGLGDLVLQITVRPLPVPSQFAPVPKGFDDWWERAMAREPQARFESARELVDSLRETLDLDTDEVGAVVTVPEPGEEEPAGLSASGNRTTSAIRSASPTARVASPTAPTIRADVDEAVAKAGLRSSSPPGRAVRDRDDVAEESDEFEDGDDQAEANDGRLEAPQDASSASPRPPMRKGRSGVAVWVALGALVVGAGGTLVAARYFGVEKPLPEPRTGADQRPRAHVPAIGAGKAQPRPGSSGETSVVVPPAAMSAGGAAAAAPSGAPPSSSEVNGDVLPPDEWRPKEVDGKLIKPEWAQPDAPKESPPPSPSPPPWDDNPYH